MGGKGLLCSCKPPGSFSRRSDLAADGGPASRGFTGTERWHGALIHQLAARTQVRQLGNQPPAAHGTGQGTAHFTPECRSAYALRRARLDLILSDPQDSRWFSRAYAGVDD